MTLTEFLLARVAEDEAAIVKGRCDCEDDQPTRPDCANRVLTECQVKRMLVEEHGGSPACDTCYDLAPIQAPCLTLRIVAAVYSDHPEFQEAWRV